MGCRGPPPQEEHASSVIPGGLRCTTLGGHAHGLLDTLSTTGCRMDAMCLVLLSHRVWCTRLMGCGTLMAGGTTGPPHTNALPTTGSAGGARCPWSPMPCCRGGGAQHLLTSMVVWCPTAMVELVVHVPPVLCHAGCWLGHCILCTTWVGRMCWEVSGGLHKPHTTTVVRGPSTGGMAWHGICLLYTSDAADE